MFVIRRSCKKVVKEPLDIGDKLVHLLLSIPLRDHSYIHLLLWGTILQNRFDRIFHWSFLDYSIVCGNNLSGKNLLEISFLSPSLKGYLYWSLWKRCLARYFKKLSLSSIGLHALPLFHEGNHSLGEEHFSRAYFQYLYSVLPLVGMYQVGMRTTKKRFFLHSFKRSIGCTLGTIEVKVQSQCLLSEVSIIALSLYQHCQ